MNELLVRARILQADPHFYWKKQFHNRSVARECGLDPVTRRGFDFAHLTIRPHVEKILNGLKRADTRQDKLTSVIGELLGKYCRVADVKNGTLYLRVTNAAVQMELRPHFTAIRAAFKVAKVIVR